MAISNPVGPVRGIPMLLLILCGCGGSNGTVPLEPMLRFPANSQPTIKWDQGVTHRQSPHATSQSLFRPADCLTDKYGIHQKMLVVRRNARCRDAVPDGQLKASSLHYFYHYFVFAAYPEEGEAQYYRIGTTPHRESIQGWVAAADVVSWNTRVGVVSLQPHLVYAEAEAWKDILRHGSTSHKRLARANLDGRSRAPWPVAEVKQVTVDGRVHELVKLHFLGERREAVPESVAKEGVRTHTQFDAAELRKAVRRVDLVFVADNTASTIPFLKAIVQAMLDIVEQLRNRSDAPDLAVTLVLYRDYVDGLQFTHNGTPSVTRVCWGERLLTDLEKFCHAVERLEAATVPSEEWAEAGYDGLYDSLTDVQFRDQLSDRVVVWIGDNSSHEPGSPKNPRSISADQIIELAKASQQVKVFSLCIEGNGGAAEQQRHEEQCETISRGTGGDFCRLGDADEIAEKIIGVTRDRSAVVAKRQQWVTDIFDDGRDVQELAAGAGDDRELRELYSFLELLEGAGIDLNRLAPGQPTVASGWCLMALQGTPLLEQRVYISRNEVDVLLAELNMLSAVLSPAGTLQLQRGALGVRIDPQSFFNPNRSDDDLTMDAYVQAVHGVPTSRGLLRFTRQELLSMPESRRLALREEVMRQIVPALVDFRNSDQFVMRSDALEFAWIPEQLLP